MNERPSKGPVPVRLVPTDGLGWMQRSLGIHLLMLADKPYRPLTSRYHDLLYQGGGGLKIATKRSVQGASIRTRQTTIINSSIAECRRPHRQRMPAAAARCMDDCDLWRRLICIRLNVTDVCLGSSTARRTAAAGRGDLRGVAVAACRRRPDQSVPSHVIAG